MFLLGAWCVKLPATVPDPVVPLRLAMDPIKVVVMAARDIRFNKVAKIADPLTDPTRAVVAVALITVVVANKVLVALLAELVPVPLGPGVLKECRLRGLLSNNVPLSNNQRNNNRSPRHRRRLHEPEPC